LPHPYQDELEELEKDIMTQTSAAFTGFPVTPQLYESLEETPFTFVTTFD
jgi:hypothetical protein